MVHEKFKVFDLEGLNPMSVEEESPDPIELFLNSGNITPKSIAADFNSGVIAVGYTEEATDKKFDLQFLEMAKFRGANNDQLSELLTKEATDLKGFICLSITVIAGNFIGLALVVEEED